MANLKAKGIILKQRDYGEANRMLTVFTDEYGIIKAASHGARRLKSRQAAASQFLCLSEFIFYKGSSDIVTVNAIEPIDTFYPIQEDIEKLSLGTYFADVLYYTLESANPDIRLLRLFLNTLYAMAYTKISQEKIKAVFELRCMACGGFMPVLEQCTMCGKIDELTHFRLRAGGSICEKCAARTDIRMDAQMLAVMRYILEAEDKKIFAFRASDTVVSRVGELTEKYIAYQLDTDFSSLDYYKKIKLK